MIFKCLAVNGKTYYGVPQLITQDTSICNLDDFVFVNFWRCITLCHDTLIFDYEGKCHFSGASQDEINLLEAGRDSGIANFILRDSESISIDLLTTSGSIKTEVYKIVKMFEFTSERKMMSAVL